jgi:hypothetical protein
MDDSCLEKSDTGILQTEKLRKKLRKQKTALKKQKRICTKSFVPFWIECVFFYFGLSTLKLVVHLGVREERRGEERRKRKEEGEAREVSRPRKGEWTRGEKREESKEHVVKKRRQREKGEGGGRPYLNKRVNLPEGRRFWKIFAAMHRERY